MNTTQGRGPVLVVSASAGTGHLRAGEAVREAVEGLGQEAVHVDVLDLAPRWLKAAYGGGFELLARRAPRVWKGIYTLSDGPDEDPARWAPLARRVLFRNFQALLGSRPWASCVCTHFLPAQLAAGHEVPFSLVVTDFELHRYWVQPRVRDYFVAHPGMADALRVRLPGARVHATGIPIAADFARAPRWQEARARFGLRPDARISLIMGGGLGIGLEENVRAALAARVANLQIVAVCGRNEDAAARLRALGIERSRLLVLDYVAEMPALFAASDVVVTKPGGLTLSEALAMGRPLVLANAIPGHEEANAEFLFAHGAAERGDVASALQRLFGDAATWAGRSVAARALGNPAAARAVAALLPQRAAHTLAAVA